MAPAHAPTAPYGSAHAGERLQCVHRHLRSRRDPSRPPYGTNGAAQAYTATLEPTRRPIKLPAYGSYGSSEISKNGNTAYTQHQTNANGTVATAQTTAGGSAAAASGKYGNSGGVAQTANGNKYAAANGNVYKNTGSGWNQTQGTPHNTNYSGTSSAASHGYGGEQYSGVICLGRRRRRKRLESREASARGSYSRGGGGGYGGRR